ncbi:MAG: hypothetical protein IM631_13085 [Cytophagales bacterium]|nr:hypothetical protein [Cytophagales bacterium]MCA6372307.1 hypothetical protein [Cytophagales bacterium]MCA6382453.1 hypothetical protein [Cytophagales bacterium]
MAQEESEIPAWVREYQDSAASQEQQLDPAPFQDEDFEHHQNTEFEQPSNFGSDDDQQQQSGQSQFKQQPKHNTSQGPRQTNVPGMTKAPWQARQNPQEQKGSSPRDIEASFGSAVQFGGDGLIPIANIDLFCIGQSMYHSLVTSHRLIVKMSGKFQQAVIPPFQGDPQKQEDYFEKMSRETLDKANVSYEKSYSAQQQPAELSQIEGYSKLNDVMIVSKFILASENKSASMSDYKVIFDHANKTGSVNSLRYMEEYLVDRQKGKDASSAKEELLAKACGVKMNTRNTECQSVKDEIKRLKHTGKVNESVKGALFAVTEKRMYAMRSFSQQQAERVTVEYDKAQFGEKELLKREKTGSAFTQNLEPEPREQAMEWRGRQR